MLFQNGIKRILKALVIAFVMLVSPAFATTYNITYDLNGGGSLANGVSNPTTYDDATLKVLDLPTPTANTGYVFRGWYDNSGFTGDPVRWIPANSTSGDKAYYAKWETTIDSKFEITTTDIDDDDYFAFTMSAAGVFYIDWGDGSDIEVIDRRGNTAVQAYSHTYDTNDNPNDHTGPAGSYTIRFDGLATEYNSSSSACNAALRFGAFGDGWGFNSENNNGLFVEPAADLTSISGSLGAIFSTIGGATATAGLTSNTSALLAIQPRFCQVFSGIGNRISEIPANLFNGVEGRVAAADMFSYGFAQWSYNGGGYIPATLFAGLDSATGAISNVFLYSGFLTSCPVGTNQAITGFESGFSGKVACIDYTKVYCRKGYRFVDDPVDPDYLTCVACQSGDTCPARGTEYICPNGTAGNSNSTACITAYNINYELNGGTNSPNNPSFYTSDSSFNLSRATNKTGYWFDGWYDNPSFTGSKVTSLANGRTGDVTLWAKWTPLQYSINYYNMSDATNHPDNPSYHTVEDSTIILGSPTKNGYTFGGWYSDSGFENVVTEIPAHSTGGVTLYAKWTLDTYTITYVLDGGTNNANNPATYTVETPSFNFGIPTKSGFVFDGWYSESNFENIVTGLETGSYGNETFYAKWRLFDSKFEVTTTEIVDDDYFVFGMSAAGVFFVDWGDGYTEVIDRTNDITFKLYSHTYDTNNDPNDHSGNHPDHYTIRFDGRATGYNHLSPNNYDYCMGYGRPAISFSSVMISKNCNVHSANESTLYYSTTPTKLNGISGSLGAIFPTIGGATATVGLASNSTDLLAIQPEFYRTFFGCSNLMGAIPAGLFDGIGGVVPDYMFDRTFYDCSNLGKNVIGGTSTYYIPATLFAGIDTNTVVNNSNQMAHIFSNTGLVESCSSVGKNQAITGFESYYGKVACVDNNDDLYCKQGLEYDPVNKQCATCASGNTCNTGFIQQCPSGYTGNSKATNGYNNDSTSTRCLQEYTINYVLDGGTNNANNPATYTVETDSFNLAQPTKNSYGFSGWCDDAGLTLNCSMNKTVNTSITYNQTFYAKWASVYSIEYDSMGADTEASNIPLYYYIASDNSIYTKESANGNWEQWATYLGKPEKSGFGFAGWCAFASQADAEVHSYTCDNPKIYLGLEDNYINVSNGGNLYLYAKWAPMYDINYYDDNGQSISPSNGFPLQYYINGDYAEVKMSGVSDWYSTGSMAYSNSVSWTLQEKDFIFDGWCVFGSQADAYDHGYSCDNSVYYPDTQFYVSNRSNLYLYAKWASVYNINYYDDSGQSINVSNSPLQYYVTGDSVRTRTDLNNDYWGWNDPLGESEKSGFAFSGWCAFDSQADAAADNYTCQQPIEHLYTGSDCSNCLNVSNRGDLYLYAKWTPVYNINYYDDSGQSINVSNSPLQYYVTGNSVRTRTDLNNDYWGWNDPLGESEKSGFAFAGWCAFDSQADAAADNYTCDDPVVELGMDDFRGRLNVSNGGNLYLYAKWVSPTPVYNIYYDNMGADIDDGSNGRPGQYNVVASNVRTRIDSNADWRWGGYVTNAWRPEKSGYEFRGWCAFDSAEAAAAADYTCQQPIEELYTGSNCSNCLNVSNRGDLYLYAKWGVIGPNCSTNQYADSNLECQPCPANYYCDGLDMHSCASYDANKPFSGPNSSSSSACSVCPEVDFSGITKPSGYEIGDFGALSKDLNGNGVNQAGECVAPVLVYNEMVLICLGGMPGTCDPTVPSSMDAGLMSCRYDSSTGGYTNCSSMAGVCDASELMSLIGVMQSGSEGVLNTELSRKGLSQNNINWNTFFGSNNIANWDSSSSIVTDRTYCSTASVQCSAGEAARFIVDSNNTLLTPSCVPCPNGFYCSNSATYTFSDSVFVEHDASNNYDIYMAGMTACTGGVATTATGATDASFCMSGESPCVPDRDNGAIISSRVPGGNILGNSDINGATQTPELVTFLDSNNEPYQACANVYVSALDSTALANSQLADPTATLSEAGLRTVVCKYNTASGKYDLCSPAFTVCDSMYVGMLQLYNTPSQLASALAQAFSKGQSSYITDSKLSRVFNIDTIESANTCSCDTGFEWSESGNTCCPDGYACCLAGTQYNLISEECEQCSGANCPNTYNKYMASCPASNGTNTGNGVIELNMGFESPYGSTVDKCTEIRLYYDNPAPLMNGLQNVTVSDLVDAGASVAFCKYNSATGNYDGDCTPKYSICEDDNLSSFFGSGTTVGMIQYVLGLNNSNEISDSLFTVPSASLGAANVTSRCTVSCPDASDFTALANPSVPGMVQMGYDLESSYGTTANECVAMRVYYNDATNLFTQYGNAYYPSQDINDWVDAGASVAFCKYNTGNSETNLCTPKYSLCPEDDVMELMDADSSVGIMQAALGISDPSTIDSNFTETPSSLASANVTNRCAAASTTCSAGQYADANLECQACPANHYCTGLNSTGGSDLTVEDNGKYACPSGSTSNGNTSSCTCSTAGYEWNSTSHTCVGITVDIDWLGVDNPDAAATCTYGGSLTLPTPNPTLSGYTFAGWAIKTGKLPSNCTELEYIQSSGTQYINTGVNVQSGSVAEVDYQITGNTTSTYGWQSVYSNTAEPMFGYAVRKSASYGDAYSYLYVNGLDVTESVDLNKHTIRQESNNFYRDGTLVQTRPVSDFSNSSLVSLFARPQYGNVYHQMVGRIYSAKIWSDGTNLSFNGIPAQCNNVVGMYDTVSKTFLTNSGSGTFTAGPVVTQ